MIAVYQPKVQTGWEADVCEAAYDGCPGAKHFDTLKNFCSLNGDKTGDDCPVVELVHDINEMFLAREEEGQ